MCQFKSALLLKDRVFVPDYDSHDQMLKELGITDDYIHACKTFVRVELIPPDGNVASDPMGWKFSVDQDLDMRPDWFNEIADEQRVKEAVAAWCKKHVFTEGEHEVHEGVWYAYGSATVTASGSATVTAFDSATVTASGSATVMAFDSATVTAFDSATVTASGSATVILPKMFQSDKKVDLNNDAICINHKTHIATCAGKWKMEAAK